MNAKRITTATLLAIFLAAGGCSEKREIVDPPTPPMPEPISAYYVSASAGDDANDGRSADAPWQSLEKVNTTVFAPGDHLLFRSGDRWQGHLRPQGSGAEGRPIRIDRYDDGPLPVIDAEGRRGAVVQLENQEYWEITHLEVTASGTVDDLTVRKDTVQGIHVIATTADHVLRHIVISDCYVHDIYSRMKIYEGGGIWVGVPGWNDRPGGKQGVENPYGYPPTFVTSLDGVLIENNRIEGVDRCGILVWTTAGPGANSQYLPGLIPSKNVIVRGNTLEDVGGDGILIMGSDAPLVERNVVRRACKKSGHPDLQESSWWSPSAATIWFHHCAGGIIQYNSVYDSKKLQFDNDGMSFDFDYNCERCIVQYNYSRNNEGGLILIMGSAVDNIVRYNISENDQSHVLFLTSVQEENNLVYNNTIYIDRGSSYLLPGALLRNNIFMAAGEGRMSVQDPLRGDFQNNCFAGWVSYIPNDDYKITDDPKLFFPGNGGENAENLGYYQLSSTSPCRNAGAVIEQNGGIDILGNPLPATTPPHMGAIQQ
jgi:hypothetical protein